jgi:hypothetical protein
MALTPINLHDYLHEVGAAHIAASLGCNAATPYGWLHGGYPQARMRIALVKLAKKDGYALEIPVKEIVK